MFFFFLLENDKNAPFLALPVFSHCWIKASLRALRKRTILFEFSVGDEVCLIASPVTSAEALEHCGDWACHCAGVGKAFILVIYSQQCSTCANLSQGPVSPVILGSSGHPRIQQ